MGIRVPPGVPYMSKAFKDTKSSILGYTDKLTFGKFKDCRICDILDEEYEYLIFLEKDGYVKYNNDLIERIKQKAGFELEKVHYQQEILPYLTDDYDDIPF